MGNGTSKNTADDKEPMPWPNWVLETLWNFTFLTLTHFTSGSHVANLASALFKEKIKSYGRSLELVWKPVTIWLVRICLVKCHRQHINATASLKSRRSKHKSRAASTHQSQITLCHFTCLAFPATLCSDLTNRLPVLNIPHVKPTQEHKRWSMFFSFRPKKKKNPTHDNTIY